MAVNEKVGGKYKPRASSAEAKDIQAAVTAIRDIVVVINQIHDTQNTIATAVEEQSVTTNEIGRVVSQAAQSAQGIIHTISETVQIAEQTNLGANDTESAARVLNQMSGTLQSLLTEFKTHSALTPDKQNDQK